LWAEGYAVYFVFEKKQKTLYMKKKLNFYAAGGGFRLWSIVGGLSLLLMFSCNVTTNLDEIGKTKIDDAPVVSRTLPTVFFLPSTVSLSKVDLYLQKGTATTGKVKVYIQNSLDSSIVGSVVVPASSIITGSAWNTFNFASPLTLTRGNTYQIHIIRSDPHNYATNNYIFWMSSSGGVDAYPDGVNDVYPSWTLDYAFKTYTNGGIDQQQTLTTYGFFIGNVDSRWQDFKADYPKVSLRYMMLNLTTGSATTGTFTVQIRSADGSAVLAQNTVPASSLGLGATQWVTFKIAASLYRDQTYRIYVTRSDAHNYAANNYVFWRTSSGGVDAYPDGVNDVYPSWTLDYSFRTYSAIAGLDQHQDLTNYSFFTSSGMYRWQEFVPRNQ
jgi:hypothetical protein